MHFLQCCFLFSLYESTCTLFIIHERYVNDVIDYFSLYCVLAVSLQPTHCAPSSPHRPHRSRLCTRLSSSTLTLTFPINLPYTHHLQAPICRFYEPIDLVCFFFYLFIFFIQVSSTSVYCCSPCKATALLFVFYT